jgi:hypothetical protein
MAKSTLEEIAARFDQDVERFSHMDTGQSTMLDSALVQELFESMAKEYTSQSPRALDLGCGAGNLSLRVNRALPGGPIIWLTFRPICSSGLRRGSWGLGEKSDRSIRETWNHTPGQQMRWILLWPPRSSITSGAEKPGGRFSRKSTAPSAPGDYSFFGTTSGKIIRSSRSFNRSDTVNTSRSSGMLSTPNTFLITPKKKIAQRPWILSSPP